jgi:sensor histidine kinase regulating citrate/malate metabolism
MTINLITCFVIVLILAACIAILFREHYKLKKHYESLMESHLRLENLQSELRTQRHDYLNHMQVVYGLLELKEYEELKTYLGPVFKDMMKTGKALKTNKPAINALLRAKMAEAEGKGIDFYIEVRSNLEHFSAADWELCRVLSNIIDNAIRAVSDNEGEKSIRVEIFETQSEYLFSIANNGPEIPEPMREAIFLQGITTKIEEGRGLGLYITRKIMQNYGGSIELLSIDQPNKETIFICRFPKKEV